MPRDTYVADRCSEINALIEFAAGKSDSDPGVGAHLAGYMSVLISGIVEDCVEHLVVERARMSNDPQLQEFVRRSMDRQFRNPKSDDIANVLRQFSETYRDSYNRSVSEQAREALGSIVSNRMALAHKATPQSTLTVNDVRGYFVQIVEILEVVERILLHGDLGSQIATESRGSPLTQ